MSGRGWTHSLKVGLVNSGKVPPHLICLLFTAKLSLSEPQLFFFFTLFFGWRHPALLAMLGYASELPHLRLMPAPKLSWECTYSRVALHTQSACVLRRQPKLQSPHVGSQAFVHMDTVPPGCYSAQGLWLCYFKKRVQTNSRTLLSSHH